MPVTTTRRGANVVGVIAVLVSAVLAVALSPMWLIATALLAAVNLLRYTVPVARSGRIEAPVIVLSIVNSAVAAAALLFLLFS